ncbi:MAG: glycosyltransferase family 2 protein [Pseudomonadota bacterium]
MSNSTVTAVVVSYHTGPRLKECLYALVSDPDIRQTIIVNNGNPPEMQAWLTRFVGQRANTEMLDGHGNIGFGAGVNLGVSRADGPDILVINPDAALRWDSITSLQKAAKGLDAPWIVGGRIFDIRGREERGPRRRELTLWRAATSMFGWNTWTLERTPSPDAPIDMPVISGAFFLTNKTSMDLLDGFDEGYFLHVEDVDLCRRCRAANGRVIYDPHAGALHYGSTSNVPSATVARHKADGLARYFKKFARGPVDRILVFLAVPILRIALTLARR